MPHNLRGSSGPSWEFMNDAFPPTANGTSSEQGQPADGRPAMTGDIEFDILDWFPAYQSCQRYFLDHAQHEPATLALCALINIRLPWQYFDHPITASTVRRESNTSRTFGESQPFISLVPYIRRLVVTGFDKAAILHGFFGDSYAQGVMPHVECERRNYLFAAKHGGWRSCKKQYDSGSGLGGGDETVPFMKPLGHARTEELVAAEKAWSSWLCMEDWELGPRAPGEDAFDGQSPMEDGDARASREEPLA